MKYLNQLAIVLGIILTACGGGGGGSNTQPIATSPGSSNSSVATSSSSSVASSKAPGSTSSNSSMAIGQSCQVDGKSWAICTQNQSGWAYEDGKYCIAAGFCPINRTALPYDASGRRCNGKDEKHLHLFAQHPGSKNINGTARPHLEGFYRYGRTSL